MGVVIKMPLINANEERAELAQWIVSDGGMVRPGDVMCVIESTKSAVDVIAEGEGILRHIAVKGVGCLVGEPIAYLAESEQDIYIPPPVVQMSKHSKANPWTKKAKILADRYGIDLLEISDKNPGVLVNEEIVKKYFDSDRESKFIKSFNEDISEIIKVDQCAGMERVLILGGGGGASLVLDIISRDKSKVAIGILDNNPALLGKSLMGVPILGGFELAESISKEGHFDVVISTIVRSTLERAEIYKKFSSFGMRFTNIIDPDVRIGLDVNLGEGNLIVYGSYIATGVRLGDNNFLAAGTYIEHHSVVGNHCTFGPRTSLSGAVKVGNQVKFGTQVAVEPQIEIGDFATIASGIVLTSHVAPSSVIKSRVRVGMS